jgi:hypothetical protein
VESTSLGFLIPCLAVGRKGRQTMISDTSQNFAQKKSFPCNVQTLFHQQFLKRYSFDFSNLILFEIDICEISDIIAKFQTTTQG